MDRLAESCHPLRQRSGAATATQDIRFSGWQILFDFDEPHRPADSWSSPVFLENGRGIAELELNGVVVESDKEEKQPMPLTPEWSTGIQARLEPLLQQYESGDFVAMIKDGEAVESSLPLEDWEDINFVYLKLLIYCAYQKRSAADDSTAAAEARRRKQEMVDHDADPECDPLSFTKGG